MPDASTQTDSSDFGLSAKEWVENQLYADLLKMPLWTLSAFGTLEDGQILSKHDPRFRLIVYLVLDLLEKVPDSIYDGDLRHAWDVKDFIPCIKAAIKFIKKIYQEQMHTNRLILRRRVLAFMYDLAMLELDLEVAKDNLKDCTCDHNKTLMMHIIEHKLLEIKRKRYDIKHTEFLLSQEN